MTTSVPYEGAPEEIQAAALTRIQEIAYDELDCIKLEIWASREDSQESCKAGCTEVAFIFICGNARCPAHAVEYLKQLDASAPHPYHVSVDILRPTLPDPRLVHAAKVRESIDEAVRVLQTFAERGPSTVITKAQYDAVNRALRWLEESQTAFVELLKEISK